DKALLELPDRLRIKNIAPVHLLYEGFQLIFHVSLAFRLLAARVQRCNLNLVMRRRGVLCPPHIINPFIELGPELSRSHPDRSTPDDQEIWRQCRSLQPSRTWRERRHAYKYDRNHQATAHETQKRAQDAINSAKPCFLDHPTNDSA